MRALHHNSLELQEITGGELAVKTVSFIALSGTGKTTLLVQVIADFVEQRILHP